MALSLPKIITDHRGRSVAAATRSLRRSFASEELLQVRVGGGRVKSAENGSGGAYRILPVTRVMSIDNAVLLLSLPTSKHLRSPAFLSEAILEAVTQTQKSLLVIVFSPLFSADPTDSESLLNAPVHHWKTIQNLLTFIYVEAAREAQRLDNILLSVDIVLLDSDPASLAKGAIKRYEPEKWEAVFALDGGLGMSSFACTCTCASIPTKFMFESCCGTEQTTLSRLTTYPSRIYPQPYSLQPSPQPKTQRHQQNWSQTILEVPRRMSPTCRQSTLCQRLEGHSTISTRDIGFF